MNIDQLRKVACLIFVLCRVVLGATEVMEKPDWMKKAPTSNREYKFYIGRSSNASDEATAFNEATRNAYETAIRENFGIVTQVQSDSYEALDRTTAIKRIQELSRNVEIHDFEQMDFYRETRDSKVSLWILYRYRQSSIELEKRRLASVKKDEAKVVFAEAGNPADAAKGILEVVSQPAGATVYIDGIPINFMETPLRLYGRIAPGEHKIRVDHKKFDAVEETFIMSAGKTVKLNKVLTRAYGKVRVTTAPSNANVVIDGKPQGTSPTAEIQVPAREPVKIEVTHASAEKASQEIEVDKGEVRLVDMPLTLKAGILTITSEPSGAVVFLDYKQIGKTPLVNFRTSAGEHTFSVQKEGYEPFVAGVRFKGGETKALPSFKLKKLAPGQVTPVLPGGPPPTLNEDDLKSSSSSSGSHELTGFPWLLGVWLGGEGSSIKQSSPVLIEPGVSIEKNFAGYVGLQLLAKGKVNLTSKYSSDTLYSTTGFEFSSLLPIYLFQILYLAPEFGFARHFISTTNRFDPSDKSNYSLSQWFYGIGAGFHIWQDTWGFQVRLGTKKYSDVSPFTGDANFYALLGVLLKI